MSTKSVDFFDAKSLAAGSSNFSISQDQSGLIYSANFNGLLIFNGNNWKLTSETSDLYTSIYYSPIHKIIFYGTKNDFGYLSPDKKGALRKYSLIKDSHLDQSQFLVWYINETREGDIVLKTTSGVFIWSNSEIRKIEGNFSGQFHKLENNLLIHETKKGISVIYNDKTTNIKGAEQLKDLGIALLSGSLDSLKVITDDNREFLLNQSRLEETKIYTNKVLGDVFYSLTLKDGTHALGHSTKGVQFFGIKHNLQISESNGLGGSVVKFIYEDTHQNVWVAMQEGISRIALQNPIKRFDDSAEIDGSPWCISHYEEGVLLGTTAGLHLINEDGATRVSYVSDHIWDIEVFKDRLFLGSRNGLFVKNANSNLFDPIFNFTGVSLVKTINNSQLVVATTRGIFLIEFSDDGSFEITLSKDLKSNTYNSVTVEQDSIIWLTAKSAGVYKWDLIKNEISQYNSDQGLQDIVYTKSAIINNIIHVFTTDGLYTFDEASDAFFEVFTYHKKIQYVFPISENQYLISAKDKFGDVTLDLIELTDNSYQVVSRQYNTFDYTEITDIEKDKLGNIWFATVDGLFKYNTDNSFNHQLPFNTLINQVSVSDSIIFYGHYAESINGLPQMVIDQPKSYQPTLDFTNNALKFEFGAPYFTQNDKIQFSYYLEGNESTWSDWNKERVKEYNNLDPGAYTFHVKSKNVFDIEGRTASYTFTILPPWYLTSWAYLIFTVSALGLIWIIAISYSYRVRQQRKNLKLVVADRTFEVLSQKKEIEKQNNLLQDQFEEIRQQRDAINEKNQELEISQEEILSINEQLHRLNQSLEKKVDERTSKIKVTVKKLQSTIAELDTFIYRASHDLKGPISRINGLTSLAKLESSNPQDLKYYDLINIVAKDMNKLLAKLTQVHEVINREPVKELVDLPIVIAEVKEGIDFLDNERNTHYIFKLGDVLQIKSDPFLISILFSNLIENSLIFKRPMQQDHELKISTSKDHDNYFIIVEDNGTGIQNEHIKKVFNMFYRGSDQSKGNGLGLYLSKMVVEKLDGKIELESEYEQFTRFTIKLPR